MRVVAGTLKGRQILAPTGHRTHPMSEKVRGGLFNVLGELNGLAILDAFAGSGALSVEAVSRGAKSVVAIDMDKKANTVLKQNIKALNVGGRIKAILANASGWSDNNPTLQFDIVLSAPPYDGIKMTILEKLVKHVQNDGLYILDWPGKMEIPVFDSLTQLRVKNYGDAQLVFYKKTG
ncbi:MAG TPA: RsmD family RNA methyltransferase [Candidatus Saccharibacteria bacterium]|nr:RsmD family RNA methyltransferase [Candidatus Saccharibacteria bacterium]